MKNHRLTYHCLGLLFAISVYEGLVCRSETINWTNTTGGNWNVPGNWRPNHVPGADDTAVIAVTGANEALTVTLDASITIAGLTVGLPEGSGPYQQLSLNGKTLTLNGPLQINECGRFALDSGTLNGGRDAVVSGPVTWTGGVLNGNLTLQTNGLLVLAGDPSQTYELYGALTNLGVIKLVTGNLDLQGNFTGLLVNLPGALIDIRSDMTVFSYNNRGTLFNWGTLRKSGGPGTTIIAPRFSNYGTVDCQKGTLACIGGGKLSSGSYFGGPAPAQLAGGTFTFEGKVAGTNAILAGAILTGSDGMLSGEWTWTNGYFADGCTLTVATDGRLRLAGTPGENYVLFGTLTNAGILRLESGNLICQGNAQGLLVNLPSGILEFRGDIDIENYNHRGTIINQGTIRKSAGTGVSTLRAALYHYGTAEATTGTINYAPETMRCDNGSRLVGNGSNLVSASQLTLTGSIEVKNLLLGARVVHGTSALTGDLAWIAGYLDTDANITLQPNGKLIIDGPDEKAIVGQLTNRGTILMRGPGRLAMGSKDLLAAIYNEAGATFELAGDVQITWTAYSEPAFFNAGLLRKSSGTGATVFDHVPFHNTGTVDVQTGSVIYSANGSSFEDGTRLTGNGTNLLAAGTITLNGKIYSENLELGGVHILGTNTLSGKVSWTKAVIEDGAVVTIAHNGIVTISGPDEKAHCGIINNQGAIFVYGTGRLAMGSKGGLAIINNQVGGLFDLVGDTPIVWTAFSRPAITNAGLFRKSAGVGTTVVDGVAFGNSGTVDVQVGTVAFNTTGTIFDDGSQLLGAGTNLLYAGYITLRGAIYSQNLQVAGAGILGTCQLGGLMTWSSGSISSQGMLTVTTNGVLLMSGPELKAINGILDNQGTIQLSGNGTLAMGSETGLALINNEAGAVFETLSDAPIAWTAFSQPAFTNAGILRKTGGTGSTLINGVVFRNRGTVDVRSGTIAYNTTGSAFESGSRLVGPGTNLLQGGFITLDGPLYSENMLIQGSGILGTSIISGTVSWKSGSITSQGILTIGTNGILQIQGPELKSITGVLRNQGKIALTDSGTLALGSATTLAGVDNQPGAVFEATGDAPIAWTAYSQPFFTNAGTFLKTGASTTVVNLPLFNLGTLEAQSGVLTIAGAYNLAGGGLKFAIAGVTNYGKIGFPSGAKLTGTVGAQLLAGFQPSAGDSFPVLEYPSYSGSFGNAELPSCAAWQTNYDTSVFRLTVLNARPSLVDMPAQQVDELKLLVVTNAATHPDSALQTLNFGLSASPEGMRIDAASGILTWTPAQTQSPSTNIVRVFVTDNGNPALSTTNALTVVVREVNMAPVLPVLKNQSVNELTQLSITNTADEPNIHSTTIGYGLLEAPAGVTINSQGIITWVPSQTQSPGTNRLITVVTNSNPFDMLNPNLSSTNSVIVIVNEVNVAPILKKVPDQVAYELTRFTMANVASESNIHSTLGYRLLNAPEGMSIAQNGVITWIPSHVQAPGTNVVVTVATNSNPFDLINPSLSATNQFTVIVYERPSMQAVSISATGALQFTIQTIAGQSYTVQYSTDLQTWISLSTFDGYGGPLTIKDINWLQRPATFYRVQIAR